MPEEKTKFSSFWGDMTVSEGSILPAKEPEGDPKPPVKEPVKPKSVEAEHEGEGIEDPPEGDPPAEPEGDPPEEPEDPEDPPASDPPEDPEYEYTDDDVSKAYGILEEEGILDLGDEDEFEATPKGLADAVGSTVRNLLKKEIEKIPPVVQEFYAHIEEGGDISSFKPAEKRIGWDEFNIESEGADDIALKAYYLGQGMNAEEAEAEIAEIPEDKKERKTEIAFNSLKKRDKSIVDARDKESKLAEDKVKREAKKDVDDLKKYINDTNELAGFALDTKVRKDAFKNYLFKINPRTGKTQMQENMADQDRRMTIAMLDFVNYTKADLVKEVATTLTKTRKKKLSRYTDKGVKNTVSGKTVEGVKDTKKGTMKIPSIFGPSTIEFED